MHISLAVYALLLIAIILEALGMSFQAKSNGMTLVAPIIISLLFYAAAFVVGGITLKTIPIGIQYAIWSGGGVILSSILGYVLNKQSLDSPALIGMGLIVSGVVVIYLYSKSNAI